MNLLDTIIQSLIQGLTEFLPVSSSGHLVLFQQFFKVEQPHMFMDIILHMGTFAAVILFFWKDLFNLGKSFIKHPFDFKDANTTTVWKIFVAIIPTAIIGLVIKFNFSFVYESIDFVLIFLSITAVFLFLSDFIKSKGKSIQTLTWAAVLFIGLAQGLAVLPGISRSGATIVACLLMGMARKEAGIFSFFIGIPAMIGAAIIELKDVSFVVDGTLLLNAGVALVLSFVVALFCIRFLFFMLQHARFKYFSIYLIVVVVLSYFVRTL